MTDLKQPTLLIITLLSLLAVGCGETASTSDEKPGHEAEAALRQRAGEFGKLLLSLDAISADEARTKLAEYLEPGPNQARRIATYYNDFSASSKKFKIRSQSIKSLVINTGGQTAQVVYQMKAVVPGGTELPVEQVTQWRKIDGKWYRLLKAPDKKLKR
ncbi:MAG: hypothetical protein R3236_07980 [Phycisphaeraceae bacterium]|nr:hypothetical protein [Phycisphaeraceae bacterium]